MSAMVWTSTDISYLSRFAADKTHRHIGTEVQRYDKTREEKAHITKLGRYLMYAYTKLTPDIAFGKQCIEIKRFFPLNDMSFRPHG